MFYEFDKKRTESPWSMSDMHCHKNFELYILLDGERSMFIENALYAVKPTSIVLIPPFVMHKTEGQSFYRVNINFSKDYFPQTDTEVFSKYLGKKIITPTEKDANRIKGVLQRLDALSAKNKNAENATFIRGYTYELLMILCSYQKGGEESGGSSPKVLRPTVLTKIIDYIDKNLNDNLTIDYLAKKFYISRSYICKLFRRYLGISVTQSILNSRIVKACELLTDSKKSVGEISEICGFSSSNYFGLIFKKHMGLSPINYRRYQKEKN